MAPTSTAPTRTTTGAAARSTTSSGTASSGRTTSEAASPDLTAVDRIGLTAGDVWHLLDEEGQLPISRIAGSIDASRDVVLQALGWLAREDKIDIEDNGRSRIVSLKD